MMASTRRTRPGAWGKPELTENGFPACRFCGEDVLPPKRTFCSAICVREHKIRTSPSYAAKLVFSRDRGICAMCSVDTVKQHQDLWLIWNKFELTEQLGSRKEKFTEQYLKPLYIPFHRFEGNRVFDVDHRFAVQFGGGETGLENLQTLCLFCHKDKTKKERVNNKRRNNR